MNVLCFRGAVRHTCLDRPTRLRRRDLIYVPLGLPTVAHGIVGKRERRLVRKRGFEPLRYCYRQPLKTIRLGQMANKSFSEQGRFRSEMPSDGMADHPLDGDRGPVSARSPTACASL